MSLPQHIHYAVGANIVIDIEERPTNAVVDIYDDDGGKRCSGGTVTVSPITTTLNVTTTRGMSVISAVSNVGMAAGGKFWIQDDPEEVLIRRIDDCNIYLRRPLVYDHNATAVCEGTRLEFPVNSTVANVRWWDGHASWNIDGGAKFYYSAVECTQYPLRNLCTVQDLYDVEPALYHLLDEETDVERLKDQAASHVWSRLAAAGPELRARVYPGSPEFIYAVSLAAMMLLYLRQPGDEAEELYERFSKALDAEIQRVSQTTPRDVDQDRDIEITDRISARSIRLVK